MERVSQRMLNDAPMRVYRKIRLQIARSLLFYDETPIGEIALICGFSSICEFSRVFRSYFDKSPSQFRDELRSRQLRAIRPDLRRMSPPGRSLQPDVSVGVSDLTPDALS
jgi:AraC family carnitine catabolism transcriptional activator